LILIFIIFLSSPVDRDIVKYPLSEELNLTKKVPGTVLYKMLPVSSIPKLP